MGSAAVLVEELALRIGYFGLGAWLGQLGAQLGAPPPYPPPVTSADFITTTGHGIRVTLYAPGWKAGADIPPDAWVFYEATLSAALPLPFGLVADVETPDSARMKLSDDVSWGKAAPDGTRSVSYFLKDRRVVIVTFHPSRVGISSVTLTRLFNWPDWRRRSVNP